MASKRTGRINEEVLKVLSEDIRTLKDPRLEGTLVSVVHCDVTGDLSYATAYISVLGTEEQQKNVAKGLKSASGYLRNNLARKLQLRHTPELIFKVDNSIERGAHISKIINETKKGVSEDE